MAAAECGEWLTTDTTSAPETKSYACQHFPFLCCEYSPMLIEALHGGLVWQAGLLTLGISGTKGQAPGCH